MEISIQYMLSIRATLNARSWHLHNNGDNNNDDNDNSVCRYDRSSVLWRIQENDRVTLETK